MSDATVDLLVPPATGAGPRELTLDHRGVAPTTIVVGPDDDSVGITPVVPELPNEPRSVFPELFRRTSEELYGRNIDALTSEEQVELDWVVAELVLEAPEVTREMDGREASAAYTITELLLDQDGETWEGRTIVDHESVWKESGPRKQPVSWNVRHGRTYLDPLPSSRTRWDAWPLPRLQTERSLRAVRDGGRPRLNAPGVSLGFWWAYAKMFFWNGTYRRAAHRFLGKKHMPGGVYAPLFMRRDKSETMAKLFENWSFRKKKSISMKEPALAESDAWLVDRILNGMHPSLLELHQGEHAGQPETQYRVTFDWNHLTFARVARRRDPNQPPAALGHLGPPTIDENEKTFYELPNARATLAKVGEQLVLRSITLQHRKRVAPGTRSEPLAGPITSVDQLEGEEVHRPPAEDLPASEREHAERVWAYAKRAFRCQLAMAGELDVHLSGAHLVTEQFLAALVSTKKMPRTESRRPGHPVWELLWPHVREVERINAFGNVLILGATGVLANATALSDASVGKRFVEQLGRRDWKGFAPRKEVCAGHRYAIAANAYWKVVRVFVKGVIDREWAAIDRRWEVVERFADTLSARSPRYRPYRGLSSKDAWEEGSRRELSFKEEGEPSMSSLPRAAAPADERRCELVQLCTYAIYHATFVHTWTNDRQFDDLGDAKFASLGLMTREPPPKDPDAQAEWEQRARPLLRDAGFTMTLARVLSHLDVGMLLSRDLCADGNHPKPDDSPVDAALIAAVAGAKGAYEAGDQPGVDPYQSKRSALDKALVCSLRSHINT